MYEEKEIKYKKRKREKKEPIKQKEKKSITKVSNKKKKNKLFIPAILTKIDYKLLFLKLFILLISMMLVTFTMARIKKYHEKQNSIMITNLNAITNATIQYFNQNQLPVNIGDSTSFILEEMKNKNLIDEIKEEEKFCNYLDSYIILTKIANEEYRLKAYLKCPSKEKTTDIKIICKESCSIKNRK